MSKGITNSMEMEQPFYVRRKPDPVPFSKFLYNSEKGTVLGRTAGSWGKKVQQLLIMLLYHSKRFRRTTLNYLNTNTIVDRLIIQVWCVVFFHFSI